MDRLGTFEIHLRDQELQKRVVDMGIRAILSAEILRDYYVQSVNVYQEEIIIYLGDKYDARIEKLKDPAWTSGIYPIKLPPHTKQRPESAS